MSRSPPLRFLVMLVAGWTALRAAFLAPSWWTPPAGAGGPATRPATERRHEGRPAVERRLAPAAVVRASPSEARRATRKPAVPRPLSVAGRPADILFPAPAIADREPGIAFPEARDPRPPGPLPPARAAAAPRLSASAWAFLRSGDSPSLAAGGLLGGSQAGARVALRLNRDAVRPLALALRLTAPLSRPAGSEAALGLDWRPSRLAPIHLVAERRQAVGREGRSAFALALYGGVAEAPLGRLRLDGYGQAGIVGIGSRDPFGDGALRVSLPAGRRLRLGAGAWAAAQPGAARLDAGPQASYRLPLAGRSLVVAADWRLRLAGDARPGSGPSLTFATDF